MIVEQEVRFAAPRGGRVDVLVIAGEHSGDEHAARMVAELRRAQPGCAVAALGGPALAGAGAQLLHDLTAASVVGLVEVLRNYGYFKKLFDETVRWIATHRPRAVCFVDYPGFNLRLASALRERGLSAKGGGAIRLLFYISPQIWAWKPRRRFTMARDLDALAVIFPFEVESYADTTLPVTFVGHPFLAGDYAPPVRYDPAGPVLLLPGSRRQAVARIFPVLLRAFAALGEREAVVLYPSEEIRAVLMAARPPATVRLVRLEEDESGKGAGMAAGAVLTSSGTMSMHCALAGIPGAVVYRANALTYLIGRWLVKVPYLGIANLLLGEAMYPEFIQGAAQAEVLAGELRACLHDPARREKTAAQAARLREALGARAETTPGAWLAGQIETRAVG